MNESNDTTEKRNEIFVLEFPEIPSSGYIWQTLSIPKGVTLISDEFIPDSEHDVGGGGVHRFCFQVEVSQKPVILALGRPWDDHEVLKIVKLQFIDQPQNRLDIFEYRINHQIMDYESELLFMKNRAENLLTKINEELARLKKY